MKKMAFKIIARLLIVGILILLLMYESNLDISYLYANF